MFTREGRGKSETQEADGKITEARSPRGGIGRSGEHIEDPTGGPTDHPM